MSDGKRIAEALEDIARVLKRFEEAWDAVAPLLPDGGIRRREVDGIVGQPTICSPCPRGCGRSVHEGNCYPQPRGEVNHGTTR